MMDLEDAFLLRGPYHVGGHLEKPLLMVGIFDAEGRPEGAP